MRFELTAEQSGFADALEDLLSRADTPSVIRDWTEGDHDSGVALWGRLAEMGVTGLLVPEAADGLGASHVDAAVAFESLGRHAVPGPWIESAAYLPTLLEGQDKLLSELASGAIATVTAPPRTPLALDADVAQLAFVIGETAVSAGHPGELRRSVDPARRLFELTAGELVCEPVRNEAAFDVAALATAATLLGLGEHMLAVTVDYVKARKQFGRAVGEYQALKHQLANVRVALDFTRPLVYGAALAVDADVEDSYRDVSAAKVHAAQSAYLAARTSLQAHGAIGYTAEYDLGLWIGKTKALAGAWGTPAFHRDRVLQSLVGGA